MRLRYWSEARWIKRIRRHYGLEKPRCATWEVWDELERTHKEKHPIIHWLTDTGIDKLQDVVYYIPDKARDFKNATIWKFCRNLWVFRKCLWNYRSWDHSGLLHFMETCARDMSHTHKEHSFHVRSEETSKELLVFAELLKRVREDDYTLSMVDVVDCEPGEKGFCGMKFVQKPNTLPNQKARSFYKMRLGVQKNDLQLAAKLFERKVLSWWS